MKNTIPYFFVIAITVCASSSYSMQNSTTAQTVPLSQLLALQQLNEQQQRFLTTHTNISSLYCDEILEEEITQLQEMRLQEQQRRIAAILHHVATQREHHNNEQQQ